MSQTLDVIPLQVYDKDTIDYSTCQGLDKRGSPTL